MLTLKRLSTSPMGLASVRVSLPAKRSPTGFALELSVTMSDPESPPSLKSPGVMPIWFSKVADFAQLNGPFVSKQTSTVTFTSDTSP